MKKKEEIDILIVEDSKPFQKALIGYIQNKYKIQTVGTYSELEAILDSYIFKVVLLDFNIPQSPGVRSAEIGFESLELIKDRMPDAEVIFITGIHNDIETAVEAIKRGASNYIEKEKLSGDRLFNTLTVSMEKYEKAKKTRQLPNQVKYFRDKQEEKFFINLDYLFAPGEVNLGKIIGKSKAIKDVCERIGNVSKSELANNILITGERGTGKELVASAIHFASERSNMPMITANIVAMSESLIDSELFGHEKGAFTGATNRKKGLFEMAHNSTLFIDEVGEIPLPIQAKLLRAIQFGEICRVGSANSFLVDVRMVYATNRILQEEVEKGSFRADLYDRLNEVYINLPPLRERREDIPLLVRYFMERCRLKEGMEGLKIEPKVLDLMYDLEWPGNIRQLEHFITKLVIFRTGSTITEKLVRSLAKEGGLFETRKIGTLKQDKGENDTRLAYLDELLSNYNVPTYLKVPDRDKRRSAFLRIYIESSGSMKEVEKKTFLSHRSAYSHFDGVVPLIKLGWERCGENYGELARYWNVTLVTLKKAFSKERVRKILQVTIKDQPHVYFLSYCWDNFDIANHIELLLRRNNRVILRDVGNVRIGAKISKVVQENIEKSDTLISLWSKPYSNSDWCISEIEHARELKESGKKPKRIAIITLDDTPLQLPFKTILHHKTKDREQRELAVQRILDEEE